MSTITEPHHKVPGEVLRAMRDGAGVSLRAMASRVGCSHSHLARVEYGERTPDLADRVARATAAHILAMRRERHGPDPRVSHWVQAMVP
jgi:transcriptional regulator with XRE-family HTH domain